VLTGFWSTNSEAHIAEGNWCEARRQYDRYRRLLREGLGVSPSRTLMAPARGRPYTPAPGERDNQRRMTIALMLRALPIIPL
jgi:hypothetical protein